jgi:hypothetical protein
MRASKTAGRLVILALIVLMALSIQGVSQNDTMEPQDDATEATESTTGAVDDKTGSGENKTEAAVNATEKKNSGSSSQDKPGTEPDTKPGTGTLLFIVFIVAAVPFVIVAGNIFGAYHYYGKRQKVFSDLLTRVPPRSEKETARLIKEYTTMKPIGVEGSVRAAMANSIIVILGVAVVYLLIFVPKIDDSIVKEVLLILTGAISSIIGFYFGGRSGREAEAPSEPAEKATSPPPNPPE